MLRELLKRMPHKKPTGHVKGIPPIHTPFEEESGIQSNTGYVVVNSESANYSKVKRKNYRVIVPAGITDGELIAMFKDVIDKNLDEATIWCFLSRDEINQYQPYTVAMVEKTKKTAIRITRR